jgi:hypothetical protein
MALCLWSVAGTSEAGVIVAVERSGESCMADTRPSDTPRDVNSADQDSDVASASRDALPSGTGASGGSTMGVSVVAVLAPARDLELPHAFSCALEERHLSLPASPVSERLQPPRT